MASEPLEQADVVHRFGPFNPSEIDTCEAAMSVIIIGTRKGLTLLGPFASSTFICSNRVVRPPIPLPRIMPISSWLPELIWSLDCSIASWLAATASWAKRSMWRASLRLMKSVAQKPFTSPPNLVSRESVSNRVI